MLPNFSSFFVYFFIHIPRFIQFTHLFFNFQIPQIFRKCLFYVFEFILYSFNKLNTVQFIFLMQNIAHFSFFFFSNFLFFI